MIVSQRDLWWWSRRQVWSCIQNFSSFQPFNFWNATSWKYSLKNNCIRSCLIERQSFWNRKIDVDPIYSVLMSLPCIVQVLCSAWYREVNMFRIFMIFRLLDHWARRILFVFWLESWPQGINLLLIIEWRLNAKPRWQIWWTNPLWITTLSCKVRSIRLFPECPWRARRKRSVPELSEQYWYLRFEPPPAAKQAFRRSSDQSYICEEWFRRWNLIFQNWIAPSSAAVLFDCVEEDWSQEARRILSVSCSNIDLQI